VAVRSEAWICGQSLAGIAGSNPAGDIDVLFLVSVVCFQIDISVTGRSFVQRKSPTERICARACVCVTECDQV